MDIGYSLFGVGYLDYLKLLVIHSHAFLRDTTT